MSDEEQHKDELAPELTALERHLREMLPRAPRVDRDRLMYAAGQAAPRAPIGIASTRRVARAPGWMWPVATATMTAATVLLGTVLVWQKQPNFIAEKDSQPPSVVKFASTSTDSETEDSARYAIRDRWPAGLSPESGYLGVRYIALTRGVNALPFEESSTAGNDSSRDNSRLKPATLRGLIDELFPSSKRTSAPRS
jgi:hypothetical protein